MHWFEGNIVEAVNQSKAKNAVFVVFVEGKDEASQKIASAVDDVDVSSKLEGANFVAIHLESGTQTFTQFSQIYRDPPVPSLYFIGRNGSPIEIVTSVSDSKHLMEKIVHIENIHLGKPSEIPATQSSAPAPSSSTNPTEADVPQPSTSSGPLDERVERAKELLEEKRMKKRVQEEEEERQKEMQRRKEGQNVQELRRWQQELELKQIKEERMREKRQEQEARQRVLEQIAQDRAARNAGKTPPTSLPAVSQPASVISSTPSNSNEARLQFRLPDGSTHCNRFDADTTLADVRQYILSNLTLPYRNFSLATVFPRHQFSSQDNASTLRELQLVPSSVIIIVPDGGSAVVENSTGLFGLVETIWMYLTYPVTRIFSILRLIIFAAPPAAPNQTSATATGPASAQAHNQSNTQQDKRSQRRSGGAYRRAGNSNVHRLHQNNSSSDDENNTWNGNSTQQM